MRLTPLNEFDYHPALARAPGISLVLFSAPGCGACRQVEAILAQGGVSGIDQLYKVDIQQATALARQFEIFHLPALLLYRDGQFHAIVDSDATPARLGNAIRQLLAQPAQDEP